MRAERRSIFGAVKGLAVIALLAIRDLPNATRDLSVNCARRRQLQMLRLLMPSEPSTAPDARPPTPRWVKAFLTVSGVLLVVLIVLHLLGLGFGPHMHGR